MEPRDLKVECFTSFEEENESDRRRFSMMSVEERSREMAALQERMWGPNWVHRPIEKRAEWEKLDW